jgi:hypothetical protein
MAIDILPLTKADIPGAVICIQKAFADDPYFRWVFDDPSKVGHFTPQTHNVLSKSNRGKTSSTPTATPPP